MKNTFTFAYYYFLSIVRKKYSRAGIVREYLSNNSLISGKKMQTAEEINEYIQRLILSGDPFFVGRFGANELSCLKTFDFEIEAKYKKSLSLMQTCAGFFPPTIEMGEKFKDLMLSVIPDADVMGIWMLPFEDYYLNKYGSDDLCTTFLTDLEPWSAPDVPWSAALAGKKVLVIHPFSETITNQYKRREKLFPDTNILPAFDLKTIKAVQTIAGEKDDRFDTWFDALDWMFQEAMKIDFDIAIIGCGAYGFPLAARIKKAGKQAIHLGGATQLMFGIKGKRWVQNSGYENLKRYFNDAWVRPSNNEKPKQFQKVEDGCYW